MKYILHYVGIMNRGGMETFLMNIYRKIDKSKIQFHFIVHGEEEGDYDQEILKLGGEIIHFPHFRENPIKYKKRWNSFWKINRDKYDVFHYHTNSLANIMAIKMAIKYDFYNIIIHAHSSYANKGRTIQTVHDVIHNHNQKYVDKYELIKLAVSKPAGTWLFGKNGQFDTIPNGIPYEDFEFNPNIRKKIQRDLNLKNNIVLGHVGNFLAVKNHEFILDIFYEFWKKYPQSKLVLIGDGVLREAINNKIDKLGIRDHIILLGSIPNVNEYLNIFDVFLFPSLYEGLPLSTIEAQINQLPLLVSKNISKEITISEKISFLGITQSDIVMWITKIESYIEENKRFNDVSISNKFNIDYTLEELLKIYNNFY